MCIKQQMLLNIVLCINCISRVSVYCISQYRACISVGAWQFLKFLILLTPHNPSLHETVDTHDFKSLTQAVISFKDWFVYGKD